MTLWNNYHIDNKDLSFLLHTPYMITVDFKYISTHILKFEAIIFQYIPT